MRTTIQFLDALKARNGGASDYAIAKIIGCTRSQISKYRTGRDFFGSETAITVANLLEIDAGFVLACCHAERARSERERQEWQGIAALFPKSIKALFVLCKVFRVPLSRLQFFA